jgi:class 3 adenylate cyclase
MAMSEATTGGLGAVDNVDRAALQTQRMVALTNLLYLLLGGPMIAFGLGFWLILGDPWLGAEIIAGLGQFLAFALARRGRHSAARLLGCALVALVYVDLVVALGVTAGVELWSIPMIAIPPLLTLPSERRLLIGIYALFAATLILAHAALLLGEPRIILDPRFAALMRATNLLLTMGFVGIMVIFYFVRINRAEAAISRERERAERLLANILPAAISARLKREERPIADQFDEVSVLFADIVGFSGFAAAHDPATVVNLLNALFYAFDDMVERRGLEKIKTIGDAYMVAAGIPTPRADHAPAIVDLAAEMIAFTDAMRRTRAHDIDLRIGIHSGRVVAGVIGKHKFSYDLWGDTVNMASRLQTTSEPGRIQISSETAQRLGPRFARQLRGAVELKGLGAVETYLLLPGSGDSITRAPG